MFSVSKQATAKVNVKELIQAICPSEGQQHNGQFQSKFGGKENRQRETDLCEEEWWANSS